MNNGFNAFWISFAQNTETWHTKQWSAYKRYAADSLFIISTRRRLKFKQKHTAYDL